MSQSAVALMDQVDQVLHEVEAGSAKAAEARRIVRAVDRLVTQVDAFEKEFGNLPTPYNMSWADDVEAIAVSASPKAVEELMAKLDKMIGAADLIGLDTDELKRAADLKGRYAALGKVSKGPAFPPGTARNLGVELIVDCDCGDLHAVSTYGDWSSIRYAAKKHGQECAVANPGLGESLVNDLDRVRHSVVEARESTRSGGLVFTVDGAPLVEGAAAVAEKGAELLGETK